MGAAHYLLCSRRESKILSRWYRWQLHQKGFQNIQYRMSVTYRWLWKSR